MLKYVFAFLIIINLESCYYNNEEELVGITVCDTSAVKYNADVSKIIETNCLVCHSSVAKQGDIILEGYNNIKLYAIKGGRLVGAIKHLSGYSPMPKNLSKLSECDISKIDKWVNEGATNN
jgi:hypothetical protein